MVFVNWNLNKSVKIDIEETAYMYPWSLSQDTIGFGSPVAVHTILNSSPALTTIDPVGELNVIDGRSWNRNERNYVIKRLITCRLLNYSVLKTSIDYEIQQTWTTRFAIAVAVPASFVAVHLYSPDSDPSTRFILILDSFKIHQIHKQSTSTEINSKR